MSSSGAGIDVVKEMTSVNSKKDLRNIMADLM